MDSQLITIAISLFLVMNAIGQIPLFVAILARYDHKRQKIIIFRELVIALGILLLFNFFGDRILSWIGISQSVIGMAGGILLIIVALDMVFPKEKSTKGLPHHEPIVVPLAIPVITGPGAITMTMLFAHETDQPFLVALAIFIAWVPALLILLASSYIKNFLGNKGLMAVERLGGMLVTLIGIQMLATGIVNFIKESFPALQ